MDPFSLSVVKSFDQQAKVTDHLILVDMLDQYVPDEIPPNQTR